MRPTSLVVANYDTSLLASPSAPSGPPSLRGYLNKYTNVAKGYNTRWFVLKDGVLSCKGSFAIMSYILSDSLQIIDTKMTKPLRVVDPLL
jgi:hypothetical protein